MFLAMEHEQIEGRKHRRKIIIITYVSLGCQSSQNNLKSFSYMIHEI